jgi:hypothetical protein
LFFALANRHLTRTHQERQQGARLLIALQKVEQDMFRAEKNRQTHDLDIWSME